MDHTFKEVIPKASTTISDQNEPELPIGSISDFLTVELIEKHLDGLSSGEISKIYSPLLPESMRSTASKSDILSVARSGFFQQSMNTISEQLAKGNGAGYLLAQSLKYNYKGEGIDRFLEGIRQIAKQEQNDSANADPDDHK